MGIISNSGDMLFLHHPEFLNKTLITMGRGPQPLAPFLNSSSRSVFWTTLNFSKSIFEEEEATPILIILLYRRPANRLALARPNA